MSLERKQMSKNGKKLSFRSVILANKKIIKNFDAKALSSNVTHLLLEQPMEKDTPMPSVLSGFRKD